MIATFNQKKTNTYAPTMQRNRAFLDEKKAAAFRSENHTKTHDNGTSEKQKQ